jgi:hypothetical protein
MPRSADARPRRKGSDCFPVSFKFLPGVKIAWSDVWIGAAATAALFVLGKFLIGLYLAKAAVTSSYGEAGAVILNDPLGLLFCSNSISGSGVRDRVKDAGCHAPDDGLLHTDNPQSHSSADRDDPTR